MQWWTSRRAASAREHRRWRRLVRVGAVLTIGLLAAGCVTDGQPTAALAIPHGATVAFESIDGAPRAVFHKLVETLSEEAATHAIPVVSRKTAAAYRIRGYIAADEADGRATFAWVWDVYDRDRHRALRISGTEAANASGSDPWDAADKELLRRIARSGLERVAIFLGAGGPTPAVSPTPAKPSYSIASVSRRDDFSPEAWGIFRIFRTSNTTPPAVEADAPQTATQPAAADVPLPRRRPRTARTASNRAVAMAATQR
jgi:hypothetical protein